ncbi:lymphocyte antigen 6E-like isoform X2 [Rhinatrema bivittatum]|uniref:lymphocyte antigen 6E-like isoform X2 n=1 Tax=Rhinatrema bivittatum TaxID=194408 RepID=UPI00112C6BBF|nr:lymphocyte antigen 6E-like isoform X2 [Rhinatrema bivittatum]
MRTVLRALLAAALCLHAVYSLKCYTCTAQNSNSNCLVETDCSNDTTSCLTIVGHLTTGSTNDTAITKQCATQCTKGPSTIGDVSGNVTTCCTTDRCNYSGATSVKISFLALLLPAGFILCLL